MSVQRQGTTLFTAILVLVATGVVVQLWLLTVSMEAVFRHDAHAAIPPLQARPFCSQSTQGSCVMSSASTDPWSGSWPTSASN